MFIESRSFWRFIICKLYTFNDVYEAYKVYIKETQGDIYQWGNKFRRVASLSLLNPFEQGLLQSHQFVYTVNGTCVSYLSAAGCAEFPLWSHVPVYT